jgi:hypothetical protein
LGKQSLLEAIFFPEAFGSGPYLLIADWNIQAPRRELSKLAVLQARIGTAITEEVPVPRVERTMVAITVDLKTKGLALRPGASLQCRAFMKFRGPKALNDKLPVMRLTRQVEKARHFEA